MEVVDFIFLRVHRTTDWSDLSEVDYGLIGFNAIEAIFWFACGVYVIRRNAAVHRTGRELLYGLLFLLFGLTDIVETAQVSSPLIWIKLLILIPLLLLRRRVLATYAPKPKLV